MRVFRRARLVALVFAVATAAGAQQDVASPRLEVDLMPRQIEVGDHFQAILVLSVPVGLAVGAPLFPEWGETWGDAEILEAGAGETLSTEGGVERFRQTLTLTAFITGELTLPAVSVELPTADEILEVSSEGPIRLRIESVLPEGDELPPPKPPAPPMPLPVGDAFWWALAAALGLCLFAAAFSIRSRRLRLTGDGGLSVDPLTALQRALARLANHDDLEAVIVGLSLELRRFLGRSCAFPAAESTTTEIRRQLQELALPAVLVNRIDSLLRSCDRIKFARDEVERPFCSAALAETAAVAEAVAAHLAPPEGTAEHEKRSAA